MFPHLQLSPNSIDACRQSLIANQLPIGYQSALNPTIQVYCTTSDQVVEPVISEQFSSDIGLVKTPAVASPTLPAILYPTLGKSMKGSTKKRGKLETKKVRIG